MANLRAGLIGLGMMGRHHARVLRELDGVDLVAVADSDGDPHGVAGELAVLSAVEELIAAGIDMAVVAVPTGLPRGGRARPGRGRRPHAGREADRLEHRSRAADGRGVRRQGPGRRRRPHRAVQPRPAGPAQADRGRRARRGLPDRHPAPGAVPGPDRRRRRGQGPRHARHRPDRLAGPEPVPVRSLPTPPPAAAARTRTWSRPPGSWTTA